MFKQIDQLSFDDSIVVGMSGGVDSSVAAALLVQQGFRVEGVMLRLWSEPDALDENQRSTSQSVREARQVADKLKIPFHIIDASEIFRKIVVQSCIDTYINGKTPNPCIICNQRFRWGLFLDLLIEKGAQYLATGHYAMIGQSPTGKFTLSMGIDERKDQSYMLSMLNQGQLFRSKLPLGRYKKTEVRDLAHKFNLSVAEKVDSQDLCFLGSNDLRSFLLRYAPQAFKTGDIRSLDGEILGQHQGLPVYTIGQRKGLGISSKSPLFVYGKDVRQNILYVAENEDLSFRELDADQVNWLDGCIPDAPFEALIKIRYKSPLHQAYITPMDVDSFHVVLENPVRDITPGQYAVIYQDRRVIAAGVIRDDL